MDNDQEKTEEQIAEQEKKERIAKQRNMTVCICKGIKLSRVLKALPGSKSVSDVNKKAKTGDGGCKGERCGPRIKVLLEKMREIES